MLKASQMFNDEQRARVTQAVIDAEAQTSCEIVPIVATRSGRYDRGEDMIGLWLGLIAAVTVWLLMQRQAADDGSWASSTVAMELAILVTSVVVAFVVGVVLGSRVGWLGRLFTPRQQMQDDVNAKAREVFFDSRVHHTAGATGLLIYVSLFEHIAVVLADRQVLEAVGQDAIDALCKKLTDGLREGDDTAILCDVIKAAGEQLNGPLPRGDGDVNELSDVLVLMD